MEGPPGRAFRLFIFFQAEEGDMGRVVFSVVFQVSCHDHVASTCQIVVVKNCTCNSSVNSHCWSPQPCTLKTLMLTILHRCYPKCSFTHLLIGLLALG